MKLINVIIYLDVTIGELETLDLNGESAETIDDILAIGSIIINHMISEEIEDNLNDIPEAAYEDNETSKRYYI